MNPTPAACGGPGVLNDGGRGNADGGGPLDILGAPPMGPTLPGGGMCIIPGPGPAPIDPGPPMTGVSAHAPGPAEGGRPMPVPGTPAPGVGPMPSLNENPCDRVEGWWGGVKEGEGSEGAVPAFGRGSREETHAFRDAGGAPG